MGWADQVEGNGTPAGAVRKLEGKASEWGGVLKCCHSPKEGSAGSSYPSISARLPHPDNTLPAWRKDEPSGALRGGGGPDILLPQGPPWPLLPLPGHLDAEPSDQ